MLRFQFYYKVENQHKDKTPIIYKSNVVCKCSKYDSVYIGETKRNIITRFIEHTNMHSYDYSAVKEQKIENVIYTAIFKPYSWDFIYSPPTIKHCK